MKHANPNNHKHYKKPSKQSIENRKHTHAELVELAIKACKKFKGLALINENYAVVDIRLFKVTEKAETNAMED